VLYSEHNSINCEWIEVRYAKVPFAYGTGFPGEGKGQAAEASLPSRAATAGLQKNILKTVTKVESYHSG